MISEFKNRKVLVTGGLGFIGSNLALRLLRAGARVVIVDSEVAGCGASRHNVAGAEGDLRLIVADVGDTASLAGEIRGCSEKSPWWCSRCSSSPSGAGSITM